MFYELLFALLLRAASEAYSIRDWCLDGCLSSNIF